MCEKNQQVKIVWVHDCAITNKNIDGFLKWNENEYKIF